MFIIAKCADEFFRLLNYAPDYQFSLTDNADTTYTGTQVGLPKSFETRKEAEPWLIKMNEFNPSVGYAIIEIEE